MPKKIKTRFSGGFTKIKYTMTNKTKAAVEEAAKLPTAEETLQIAYDTIKANQSSEHKDVDPVLLHAIESHTASHTAGLRERVKELETATNRALEILEHRRQATPGLGASIIILKTALEDRT